MWSWFRSSLFAMASVKVFHVYPLILAIDQKLAFSAQPNTESVDCQLAVTWSNVFIFMAGSLGPKHLSIWSHLCHDTSLTLFGSSEALHRNEVLSIGPVFFRNPAYEIWDSDLSPNPGEGLSKTPFCTVAKPPRPKLPSLANALLIHCKSSPKLLISLQIFRTNCCFHKITRSPSLKSPFVQRRTAIWVLFHPLCKFLHLNKRIPSHNIVNDTRISINLFVSV